MSKNNLNWIHWSEKEPEHDEWIIVTHLPSGDNPLLIESQRYYKSAGTWEKFKRDEFERCGDFERFGWDYWISAKDFPNPYHTI